MSYSRDSENDLNYNRGTGSYTPNILYGYTNSSIEDIQLYAWECVDSTFLPEKMIGTIVYTREMPEIGSGIRICSSNGVYTVEGFLQRTGETTGVSSGLGYTYTYNRDSSKDTIIQANPPRNLFTDTTTLVSRMMLYDSTGGDSGYEIGQVVTSSSFRLYNPPHIIKFDSSGATTWYLDSDGDLYGCGDNQYGQQGISSSTSYVSSFTKRASNVRDFECTSTSTWYITNEDVLYGCGLNDSYQMGNGTTTNVETFTQIATNVNSVTANPITTWYITNDHKLYGTGNNNNGQHSTGGIDAVTTFTQRASDASIVKTGNGGVTWYLTTDGRLLGCGGNVQGNQGDGTGGVTPNRVTTFTQRASGVSTFDCTAQETWYVTTSGALYGCGRNNGGQQGISTDTARVVYFTQRASNVKSVKCSDTTTWYITNDNKLYGAGLNSKGQMGNGTTTNVTAFTQLASNVKEVYPDTYTTWYLTIDGKLYGTGDNSNGNQGSGDTTNVTTFTQRGTNVKSAVAKCFVINILNYYFTSWYLNNSNELYGCGDNQFGQQASGDTTNVTTFTKRAG